MTNQKASCQNTSSQAEGWKIVGGSTCSRCSKEYGKTNLVYKDREVWVTCDCDDKNKIYFVNTKEMKFIEKVIDDCPVRLVKVEEEE